jgi:hypothetical protein
MYKKFHFSLKSILINADKHIVVSCQKALACENSHIAERGFLRICSHGIRQKKKEIHWRYSYGNISCYEHS